MVSIEQTVSMYRSHKNTFEDELEELNQALTDLGINCEVMSKVTADGEELIFRKRDL